MRIDFADGSAWEVPDDVITAAQVHVDESGAPVGVTLAVLDYEGNPGGPVAVDGVTAVINDGPDAMTHTTTTDPVVG